MPDAEFLAWLNAFIAVVSGDLASYPGITAPMMTDLGTMRDDYADALLAHNLAQEAAKGATIAKNNTRLPAQNKVLNLRDLTTANGVDAAKYAVLGFPSSGPSGESVSSATVPIAIVDWSQRLKHIIDWSDASAPGVRRKPAGVDGLEIWLKIGGTPPGSEKDCQFLTLDTRTPHTVDFDAADAGKMAYYMFRWQFRDGSKSAWGDTVSATITG